MTGVQRGRLLRLAGVELDLFEQMAEAERRTRMAFLKELIRAEAIRRGLLPNPYPVVEVACVPTPSVHARAGGADQSVA